VSAQHHRASSEQCLQACEHVAQLHRPQIDKTVRHGVHEQEEMMEMHEAGAKQAIATVRKEMLEPRKPFEQTVEATRKVPASTMRYLRGQYEQQGLELKRQREASISDAEKLIVEGNAAIAKLKADTPGMVEKAVEADGKSCSDECIKNASTDATECMLRAKSADELPPCLVQSPGAERR
jgi:electron transfer flavoprotein alpha subunit